MGTGNLRKDKRAGSPRLPLAATLALALQLLAACGPKTPAAPPPFKPGEVRAPDGSLPPDDALGRSIRRGHALLVATRDSLPDHVGNKLRCTSCHLDEGHRPGAIPFTGVYVRFPQYRSRVAAIQSIEDRVNDCLERSMNGKALALDDPAMRDIVAYFAFVSKGIAVGDTVPGQGVALGKALTGDTTAGGAYFARTCVRCHGANGEGTTIAPPLWGPMSFNIGAGMTRLRTLTGFIRHNMPFDLPGSTSEADAVNVAAYIASRPRPDFAGKERDWPKGDAPKDVPYPTLAASKKP